MSYNPWFYWLWILGKAQEGHLIAKIFNGSGDKATMTNELLIEKIKQIADNDPALAQWLSAAVGGYTLHVIGIEAGTHISVNRTVVKCVGYQNQL